MPCKDVTAQMIIELNLQDEFIGFEYNKFSCAKPVGSGLLEEHFRGKEIQAIASSDFVDIIQELNLDGKDEEIFLTYIEWEALVACVSLYMGYEADFDSARYKLTGVEQHPRGTTLIQETKPPEYMPKIIPCCKAK